MKKMNFKRRTRKVIAIVFAVIFAFNNLVIESFAAEEKFSSQEIDETFEETEETETVGEIENAEYADTVTDGDSGYIYKDENVCATISITSQWDGGYIAEVSIKNISNAIINGWNISFSSDDKINNAWNCSINNIENEYSMSSLDYNSEIAYEGTITMGFQANGKGLFKNFKVSYELSYNNSVATNEQNVAVQADTVFWEKDDLKIEYVIVNSWAGASEVKVRIYNNSDEIIHNWALRYITDDELFNPYNAQDISEGSVHVLKNLGWNQDIPANDYVEFGYIQYYNEQIDIPEEFELLNVSSVVSDNLYSIYVVEQCKYNNEGIIQIVIENTSSNITIEDWSLTFDANFTIEEIWNAELVSQEETAVSIINASYSQNINPGESLIIGMRVFGNEKSYIASNYKLKQISNMKMNNEMSYISEVLFSNSIVETKSSAATIISAKVVGGQEYELMVYRKDNDAWKYVGKLYDNGNMSANHDEIMNDGIYTNLLYLYSDCVGEVEYKVSLIKNGKEIDNTIKTVEFYEVMPEQALLNYVNDCNSILSCVDAFYKEHAYVYNESTKLLLEYIRNCITVTEVKDVSIYDGNTIIITFINGLEFSIETIETSNLETMSRGSGNNSNNSVPSEFEVAITKSSNIVYWAPFDSDWGNSDETEGLKNIINDSIYSESFVFFNDENANISALKNLNKYGLIILATHGMGGNWIVTGEKATAASIAGYVKEISSKQISIQSIYDISKKQSAKFYSISPEWINLNISNLPNSIVINNSCYSLNDNWTNAFIKAGAKAYFGNDGKVTNEYATDNCLSMVSELITNGNITGYSYGVTLDTYYDEGASFRGSGQGNLAMQSGCIGIGFEDGISSWEVTGDCRVLHKIGKIEAIEGNYMGMISTGVGYTMSGGSIAKTITIPDNAENMYFSWNFVSAEFLEYINSRYDDPFYITINYNGNEEKIFTKSVNSLAEEFGATRTNAGKLICVSPDLVLNGYNDIWMTNWQESAIDISSYAGKTVVIKFSADNAADTAYPSAMLLDAIHFDMEEYESDEYIDLNSFARGWGEKNTTGKSYILYIDLFENQAKKMQKTLKSKNGYVKLEQTEMKKISTETEFVEAWNSMSSDETKIDNVAIMMHGNYYAIIIDADNKENMVVDDEGLSRTDSYATPISSLNQKQISTLNLYTCNAGLLDAININYTKICEEGDNTNSSYVVNGNVAQAFLKLGGIDKITAYDGSVGYSFNNPRLSYTQNHTFDYIQELKKSGCVVVSVNRYNGCISDYPQYSMKPDNVKYLLEYGIAPNGEVEYDCANLKATYKYDYKDILNIFVNPIIKKYKKTATISF